MVKKPLVSILMPVYDAALYLQAAIESVIAQDYSQWELLVVDDFSTDNSHEIIEVFAAQDSRIKLASNSVKGIVPALQMAFKMSAGTFITRMDSDDLMPSDKLTRFVEASNNDIKTIITGKVRYFSDSALSEGYKRYENWLNDLVDSGDHWKQVYRECIVASPNWMAHRACFEQFFSFADLVYPEDYDMVFNWYAKGFSIKAISGVTHLWREHPNRTSRHALAYQQAAFFELKTNRFVNLELENGERVQLIGAGNKGKMVAKILEKHGVLFDWFDVNAAKFGAPVLGHAILPVSDLKADVKSIITVWPVEPEKQDEIEAYLKSKQLFLGKKAWLF